jgi:transposase, IS30 family
MTLTRGCTGSGLKAPGDQQRPGGLGHRLSWSERMEIMRGRDQGLSYAEIARRIGRDKAVVWREVDRNQNPDGDYHAGIAHSRAGERARRPMSLLSGLARMLRSPTSTSATCTMKTMRPGPNFR